jgi:GNAT superfamily N-acetyltransferase
MYKFILNTLIEDMEKSEQDVNLVHYSPEQGLKTIEPRYHGVRGIGAEVRHTSPEHKMSFYYIEGTKPEDLVVSNAKSKYTTKLGGKRVYDIATDPEGVISAAKEKTNEKSINRGVFTHDDMHHAIKSAGYHGFKNSSLGPQMGNVIAMYHPMAIHQEEPIEFGKSENDLEKMSQPMLKFPKINELPTRTDQEVKTIDRRKNYKRPQKPEMEEIFGELRISQRELENRKVAHKVAGQLPSYKKDRVKLDTIKDLESHDRPSVGGYAVFDPKSNTHAAYRNKGAPDAVGIHEAQHMLLNKVHEKFGEDHRLALVNKLLSHLHPDDHNALHKYISKMYSETDPHFDEEKLMRVRDLISSPQERQRHLSAVERFEVPPINYNRLKSAWKNIHSYSKNLTADNVKSLGDDYISEKDRAAKLNRRLGIAASKDINKSENDLEKGFKSAVAGLGLMAGLAGDPSQAMAVKPAPQQLTGPTESSVQQAPKQITQTSVKSPKITQTPKFGSQPEDHFLHNVMQVETSGGKNLKHPEVKFGTQKGTTAVGRFALMPNTIKEIANRYRLQGNNHPEVSAIHKMPAHQVSNYVTKNPHVELELARSLARHVIGRHGNNERAAYAWKYGHNLTPKRIDNQKLANDPYTKNFALLNRGQSIEGLTPASVAFGSRQVAGDIKKTEDLEKGINGDWKSEGYKIKVREGKYGHGVYAYGPDRKRVGHALMGKYPSNSGHLRVSASEIQEPHQGKGLYQAMLQAAADHAQSLGHKGIMSEGFQRSPDATRAWEKVSHRTIDSGYPTTQRHKQPDGSWEDVKVHTPRIDHYLDKAENTNDGDDFDHSPSDPAEFHQALIHHASKNPYIKDSVHIYSPEEYASSKTFLSKDKNSGYALKPDGELMSVFSGEKGRGDHLMNSAIKNGAMHLDAFDGYLPKFYSRHGFKEHKREKNWTEGGPDVVYMKRDPVIMVKSENNSLSKPSAPQQLTGPVESSSVQQPLAASSSVQQAPKHSEKVRSIAESYMKSKGQTLQHPTSKVKVDPAFGAKVATAYDQMPHNPHDPEVKAAYQALNKETLDQFNHIMSNSGLKISKMKSGMPNPYMNSKDMTKDIHENNHLWYYPSDEGFGSSDFIPTEHPSLTPTEHLDSEGKPMLANDLFRIVHDYFGHAKEGNTFNHDGEENAYLAHRAMFSPLAARAMSANTRGQNSWVNFGPHGEHNRKNPAKTIYADQKVGLLPEWAEQPNLPMKKSESDLAKGSLQSRLGNPKKNIASKEYTSMNRWKNSVSGRDTIPEASPEHKQRFFHKLHSQTEVRKHPKTGERLFLMHRGVGEFNSRIPHEFNKTSWTPDYSIAQGFATNDDDRDGVKRGKIHSAWIPESAIHNYINNAASKNNTDLMHEQEYIINPHKFIYAKKQKLDPSQIADSNINARQNLRRIYGEDTAYNGENRASQEIKQFNKKLPKPKKLETPESIPTPEKLAASESDKVRSFIRHPREVYNDKKKENKRKLIAEGKRKQTGAKKPLDAAIDQIKLDKTEFIDEEELLEKNRPQREGEFHPSQPWTARQHSLGELMWSANDQQAAKIDSFVGNKASHQSLFSKLPQTHRQAYRDMVSQVSKDPDRHFIPSQHGLGGEQKVRARHLKSLLMGDPSVRIDTSNPDRLTIHRQSHTKGTGAANISIHFPTKAPNETTSGNDRPRTSGSVPYGQRIEKSDSRGSRNVMGEDWLGNKQEATIKLAKGSFQSRNKSKASPQEIENTKKWVNATNTVTEIPSKEAKEARENLKQPPEMLNRLKQKLGKETHLRTHPETGEILALLHRGMSHEEHDAYSDGSNINHDHTTSWTTRKGIAKLFGGDYADKRVVSAWVPISKITAAPYLIPAKKSNYSQDDIFQNAPRSEKEIIVGPDHNSLMTHANFEPKKDTIGQKVRDFKGGRWNRNMIVNQINKEKEQGDLAASENTESDLKKMSQPIPSFPKIKSITTRPDSEIKPVERNNLFLPPKNDKISKLDGSYGIPRRFSQGDIAAKKFQAKMGRQDPNVHEIVRESVDQIARPNGGVTGSVISTKDKKVIMGHYNPKANDDAQMHEAFHFSTKQIGQKLGLNESQIGKISSHLLSHIHPDDYKAFRTIVASRGYDPRRSDFDEEVVAHMGNYLNNKGFRDYSHSVHNNAGVANAPESGILKYNLTRNPHETLNPNRFKAGYKKLIRASKDLDEDKIRQITSDTNNET